MKAPDKHSVGMTGSDRGRTVRYRPASGRSLSLTVISIKLTKR